MFRSLSNYGILKHISIGNIFSLYIIPPYQSLTSFDLVLGLTLIMSIPMIISIVQNLLFHFIVTEEPPMVIALNNKNDTQNIKMHEELKRIYLNDKKRIDSEILNIKMNIEQVF